MSDRDEDAYDRLSLECDRCRGAGVVSDAPPGLYVPDGDDMRPCQECGGTGALHDQPGHAMSPVSARRRARIAKERIALAVDHLALLEGVPGEELVREGEPAWHEVKAAWEALNRAAIVLGKIERGEMRR